LDLQRLLGLDLQPNDGACFVHRNAECFTNAKRIADVQDRCGLGMNRERASQALRGQGAITDEKSQMEVTKDFQGIDPGFKPSRFVAEESGSSAHDRQKLPGTNSSRQFERWSRLLGSGRKRAQQDRQPESATQ